jgi:hypothetical protein
LATERQVLIEVALRGRIMTPERELLGPAGEALTL